MDEEKRLLIQLKNPVSRNQGFKILVSQYKERLYWHIRRIVLNHDDTDDVLQNTFIKIYNGIEKFNEQSKLYSWMYRIATNESLTFLKKKSRQLGVSDIELAEKMIGHLQSDVFFDGDEIQLKLQKAIALLPEKQRLVFNMKYFDALKYEAISEILETSVGALKASYHIAVKKLEVFLTAETL